MATNGSESTDYTLSERYKAFIQNSSEGIWRFELDEPIPVKLSAKAQIKLMFKHAYLAETNQATAKMYGFKSAKSMIGMRLGEFLPESDPENIAFLTAFVESGYNLAEVDSHELDSKGNEKYFRNSLVGIVEGDFVLRAWGTQQDVTEQRIAAERVQKSEERLNLALQASAMGLWEWNILTGDLYWSPELKKLFGLKQKDEVSYEKYISLMHPKDRPFAQKAMRHSMKTGETYHFEHRVVWPDGTIHWLAGRGKTYFENGKPARMVGTSTNIDVQKHAENVMKQQNLYLEALHSTAMEVNQDIKDRGRVLEVILQQAGVITNTKHGYIYLLSRNPNELVVRVATGLFKAHIGRTILKGEGLAGTVWQTGKTVTVKDYDKWNKRQKGFPRGLFSSGLGIPLRSNEGVVGVIVLGHKKPNVVFTDEQVDAVTRLAELASIALKNARLFRELEESEERFRTMADTAPVFIWLAGTDKLYNYFNKPWLEFTGRSVEEEWGNGWIDGIHPDDRQHYIDVYAKAFDARGQFSMEYRLRRKDGAYRWVLGNGIPRFTSEGDFQGYIGSCFDIHELKRADEIMLANSELKSRHAQLVALNNSKDEFISLASHQLRTPATGVKQYIGMLLEGYAGELTDYQMKLLNTAYESNQRQLMIVDDLLRVAHIDAGKVILRRRKINLATLVRDVINEQQSTFASRKQTVDLKIKTENVMASVDVDRLRMVIENLLDNASKYSPHSSTVTVEVCVNESDALIEIRDQGVGIGKNDIHKLFQKFSRVSNSLSTLVGGTGIGLYWAKKIVDLHGGSITVKSKLHHGTTFTVQLPL